MRKDKYAQHENLRNETRPLLQKNFRSISLFTRHVGQYFIRRVSQKDNSVQYFPIMIEKKGRCDDWFVLPCILKSEINNINTIVYPIHGEIETKTGKSILSPDQIKWKNKCANKHWLWFENRDSQETVNKINQELIKRNLVPWINLKKI